MYSKILENYLSSAGYHGGNVTIYSNGWYTTFWNDEYKIDFSISIKNGDLSCEETDRELFNIFKFIRTKNIKNISRDDNIVELLKTYLIEQTSYENIQIRGEYVQYICTYKNGVEYHIHISMATEEDCSLDKFDEDHDEILELYKRDIIHILEERSICNYKVDITPDFLSVQVSFKYDQTIHNLDVHAVFDNEYSSWYPQAAHIIGYYWDTVTSSGESFLELLKTKDSFELESVIKDEDNTLLCVYMQGRKYQIKINVEKEVVPFDEMDGHDFEQFCAKVLASNGFAKITVTQGSGDQGIDIIAYKDEVKYGIQCKCYSSDIGNRAVQEVLAGKNYYKCHIGVVLTNRYFTRHAIELAQETGIILWNRDKLIQMVEIHNAGDF